MTIITTRHSMYGVKPVSGGFLVRKLDKRDGGDFLAVGEERFTSCAELRVGAPAYFDSWHTSTILKIAEAE